MLAPNISTNNDTSCKVNICIQNKASAVQTTLAFHMTAHFLSLSLAPSDRVVTSVHAVLASSDPALCFFLRLFSFFFIFASHAFFRASSIFFAALRSARDCDRLLRWLPARSGRRERGWNHRGARPGGAVEGTFCSGAIL